jgi:hypothetical protein
MDVEGSLIFTSQQRRKIALYKNHRTSYRWYLYGRGKRIYAVARHSRGYDLIDERGIAFPMGVWPNEEQFELVFRGTLAPYTEP